MKKVCLLLVLLGVLISPARAISAKSAILMDGDTEKVLWERNPDQRSLIASTTKIMTALVISEACNPLEPVEIPAEAVGIEGSSMYLQAGERLTVQDLLYGLMLRSGNDAAVALAIHCAGSVPAFADRMNVKAQSLGLTHTHFENPHGLDSENHYSTARDLARLTAYAMKNPVFAQTVSTKSVTVGNRTLQNHNKLLWRYPGADGVKTGYTMAAGRILVSSAVQKGRRLIAVTLSDPRDWQDHAELLDSGFSQYQPYRIEAGEPIGSLRVLGGKKAWVSVCADAEKTLYLYPGEALEFQLPGPGFVYAGVDRGTPLGEANMLLEGKIMGRISVHAGETVEILPEPPGFFARLFGGTT